MSMQRIVSVFGAILVTATVVWAESEPIRLGAPFSLSGFGARGGQDELNAAQLAVEELNAKGGIDGTPIQLIAEDTRSDLKQTVNAVQKLLSVDKVDAIVGPNWAEFSEVAAPVVERAGKVQLSTSGYSETLTKNRPHVFTMLESHDDLMGPLAAAVSAHAPMHIAILTSPNSFFESITRAFKRQLAPSVKVDFEQLLSIPTNDYRSVLLKLKSMKLDGIVVFMLEGGPGAAMLTQIKQLNVTVPIYSYNLFAYDPTLRSNPAPVEGVSVFDFIPVGTKEFHEAYRKRYGQEALPYAAKAYDAVAILARAVHDHRGDADAIARTLSNLDTVGLSGRIRFRPDHVMKSSGPVAKVYVVRNGKLTEPAQ